MNNDKEIKKLHDAEVQDVCNKLLEVFKASGINEIENIKYYNMGDFEQISLIHKNGYTCSVNVTADSKITMVYEVMRAYTTRNFFSTRWVK